MVSGRSFLRSSTAIALITLGGGFAVSPALANCVTSSPGTTTVCDTASPNPYTTTVGTGPLDHNRTVTLLNNAGISVVNRNVISVGDNARITMNPNSTARANNTSGGGLYGTGNNLIEFNSNGTLLIGEGASIIKTGPQGNAEPINVHGFGNRIENRGLVQAENGAAIWFEDWTAGTRNVVDNYGIIRRVGGGPVMGTNGGSGIQFYNRSGARVEGNLSFAGGNDDLFFFESSVVTGSINGGGGTNNLTLEGGEGTVDTLRGDIANFATLTKDGDGRWNVTGTLTGFRSVTVHDGVLGLSGNNNNFTGIVTVDPDGVLEARAQSLPEQTNPANNLANVRNNGLVRFVQPDDGTYLGQIVGSGAVEKRGAGVLTLAPSAAANTYSGGTFIDAGTISVSADSALGATSGILVMDGGTLRTTASFATTRATTLEDGGGTFETTGASVLTHNGAVSGEGALTKTGTGTLILNGANAYAGGTNIDGGVLQVSRDSALGATTGGLTFDGGALRTTASFASSRDATVEDGGGTFETAGGTTLGFAGDISGPGAVEKSGTGTMVLTGAATHSGGTTISGGTLSLGDGGNTGSLAGDVANNGTLVFDRWDNVTFRGAISGSGGVTHAGGGATRLQADNSYAGPTRVASGTLFVNGDQTGEGLASVASGGAIGGTGRIGGDLAIASGGRLRPGDLGGNPGTFTVGGDVGLVGGSILEYEFGEANVAGGPFNDLTVVEGDLTLDGTINVVTSPGGRFDPGVYRVFSYAGALTNNGLNVGTIPEPGFYVQTSIPNQVNLINTTGLELNWWDGDAGPKNNGVANGGDGTWQASAGNDNWTDEDGTPNAPFSNGSFAIFPTLPGNVTVDNSLGQVSVSGMQFLVDGYVIGGDPIELVGDPRTPIRVGDGSTGGDVTATIDARLFGDSQLSKTDLGTLILTGDNAYTGGTEVVGGVLQVDRDANLGAAAGALRLDDGTLRTMASFDTDRATSVEDQGGVIETAAGTTLTLGAGVTGDGRLTKTGDGRLILTGAGSYTGGTTISAGSLNIGAGGATGSILGDVRNNASLIFNRSNTLSFEGEISGTGSVTKAGRGNLRLLGDNSYAGPTDVLRGGLYVNGAQTGAGLASVADGATLGGNGVLGGDLAFVDGATLAPGDLGAAAGTLSVRGNVGLTAGTTLDYSFGRSNVPGGPFNDLTIVGGDLTLDGTINVVTTTGGAFDPGVYRVFEYAGALDNQGLEIGRIPAPGFYVQTSIPNEVNLINTTGLELNWWDGDAGPKNNGVANGGDGIWQSAAGNDNWTDEDGIPNAPFSDGAFAIFPTLRGNVTVDNSLGQVSVSGMQFLVDGYVIGGGSIELVGDASSTIRVGHGASTGAAITATIDSQLFGDSALRKTDLGTLVLTADNAYAGGTEIDGGVLQISRDANLGAADGAVTLDDGTLRTTASFATARAVSVEGLGGTLETATGTVLELDAIGGDGALTKAGAGAVLLTGSSTYAGGTTIAAGTLALGDGGTGGAIAGDVLNNGQLVFNRSNAYAFGGAISGAGNVIQAGTGTTTLSGANTYSGRTEVASGTLAAGGAGVFSAGSRHGVAAGATLDVADHDQAVLGLNNAGVVSLGGTPGTRLTVRRGYAGDGGVLRFATRLGGDDSPTDVLAAGSTSGASVVEVRNAGGRGAQTDEGIKIIDVSGASDGVFTLRGDYVLRGQQVVVGGAYGYALHKNGRANPSDGDWYLRSELVRPVPPIPPNPPAPPIVQPVVPVAQAYPATLLSLLRLPTMQQRIGNRYWAGEGNPEAFQQDGAPEFVEEKRAWARIEGSWSHLEPGLSTGSDDWDIDTWQLQVGIDQQVRDFDESVLIGGLTFQYGQADTSVTSFYGDGSIDTDGYGLGASLTWFRDDGVYVDGQGQLMWFRSDLSSSLIGEDVEDGNDGFGWALGVEAGKRIAVNDDWTVTPQAQLAYASAGFDSFTDPFGGSVSDGDGASMPLRLGVSADQERAWTDKNMKRVRAHMYGIANFTYDFMDDTSVSVGGETFRADYEQAWGSLGVGGSYSWDDDTKAIYGEGLVATSLSSFGDNYTNSITFGFRAAW